MTAAGTSSSSSSATSSRYVTGNAPGRDERVAARDPVALDARERDGDALARLGPLDRAVVHLHAAHAHVEAARLDPQLVALADRPGPERAGHDRADPAQREDAVDVEAGGAVVVRAVDAVRGPGERGAQLVEPGARLRADGDDLGLGHELARLGERELERLLVDGVAFVTATTPRSIPSRRRIARCSCVCGRAPSAASITSRKRSIPVAPATMLRTKRSWPGTSTSESLRPSGSSSGA